MKLLSSLASLAPLALASTLTLVAIGCAAPVDDDAQAGTAAFTGRDEEEAARTVKVSTQSTYDLVSRLPVIGEELTTVDGVEVRVFQLRGGTVLLGIGGRKRGGLYTVGKATDGLANVRPGGPGKVLVSGERAYPVEAEDTGRLVSRYDADVTYKVEGGVVREVTQRDASSVNGGSSPQVLKPMTGPGPELLTHLSKVRRSNDMKGVAASLLEVEGIEGVHLHLVLFGNDDKTGGFDLGIDTASVTSWSSSADQVILITTADAKYRVSFKSYAASVPGTVKVTKL